MKKIKIVSILIGLCSIAFLLDLTLAKPEIYSYSNNLIEVMSLANGNNFYLVGPDPAQPLNYCGSGGCSYRALVGKTLKESHLATGFDIYTLDCTTGQKSFSKNEPLFGYPEVDRVNRIIKVRYDTILTYSNEDIYHIGDDGVPELIASYNSTCGELSEPKTDIPVTLFRSTKYPANITKFE